MDEKLKSAVEAVKRAASKKERGLRGPRGEKALVDVRACDVICVCKSVQQVVKDRIVDDLCMGAERGWPERTIYQQSDDLYHLLDLVAQVNG